MSFFKDFKEDLSQAVNELVADEELKTINEQDQTEEKENDEKIESVSEDVNEEEKDVLDDIVDTDEVSESNESGENDDDMQLLNELFSNDRDEDEKEDEEDEMKKDKDKEKEKAEEIEEDIKLDDVEKEATKDALRGKRSAFEKNEITTNATQSEAPLDELTEITKATILDGNIITEGSMNVYGKIKGNVACRGKLVICGTIVGASRAAEIYTNNAKVDGDVTSDGSIKVGNGSIIIGNVYGTSAVIAGAVKGDIDVHGPVIIDGTAVVQGNIRSRSVQINNGAAIEGAVSQCYAEIDYAALFDKTFAN